METFILLLALAGVIVTEDGTTSMPEEFTCDDIPDAVEASISCPHGDWLLRALGSRSPFFGDVMGATCTNMNEQVYEDEENIHTVSSLDDGFSLNAECPDENHVIAHFKLCVADGHIQSITMDCRRMKDPGKIIDRYTETSDEWKHSLVDCGENGAIQNIRLMDSGNGVHTRVVFDCIKIEVEDKPIPEPGEDSSTFEDDDNDYDYEDGNDETTSSTEEFNCDPPEGAEPTIFCPDDNFLLRAMGSRSPFFGDAMGATCTNMNEQVYEDEEEVFIFFSLDGGVSMNAGCPDENHVIVQYQLCVKNGLVPVIIMHCRLMKDPDRIIDRYNATSDEMKHTLVDCGENGAIQKIYLMDSGNGIHTRIVFTCVKIQVKEEFEPDEM